MFRVQSSAEFDAAHFLLNTDTPCDVLHGHRWKLEVVLKSDTLTDKGFIINFVTLKRWLKEITDPMDHNMVNYFLDQTTAENLCFYFFRALHKKLWSYNKANGMNVEIEEVRLAETPGNIASFSIRDVDLRAESARRAAFKMWSDPEKRENIMKGLREANKDPILRKLRSDRMKEDNPMARRDVVEKMLRSLTKSQKKTPNRGEQKLADFFKENGLPLTFCGDGSLILGGKIPDFANYDKHVLVEYNGRFWHSANDVMEGVTDDSAERIEHFKKLGWTCYVIWDDEFEQKKQQILKDLKGLLT